MTGPFKNSTDMAPKTKKQVKSGKGRDQDSTRDGDEIEVVSKSEQDVINFPLLQTIDIEHSLPKLHSVMCKPDSVLSMEDVDRIQLELEAMLSLAVRRRKLLCHELDSLGTTEKKRGRPPGGSPGSPGKMAKINSERTPKRFKQSQTRIRDMIASSSEMVTAKPGSVSSKPPESSSSTALDNCDDIQSSSIADPALSSSPVVKNDIPDRFWATMEQYCGPITAKDIAMLERLREDQELVDEFLSVPPLGKHYSLKWAEEDGVDDSGHESDDQPKSKSVDSEQKGGGLGALTQRLVSGLVALTSSSVTDGVPDDSVKDTELIPRGSDTDTPSAENSCESTADSQQLTSAAQLERRLKRELTDQGLLTIYEEPPVDQDQLLSELIRCQKQLRSVSAHNMLQLDRLLKLSRHQLRRQQLKSQLQEADEQVQEAYRAVASARQQQRPPSSAERDAAWRALRSRDDIIKVLEAQFPSADS